MAKLLLSGQNLSKEMETIFMKAIVLSFKAYLKPEELVIYTNLARTRLAVKCEEYGIRKNESGYYKREDLDLIVSGGPTRYELEIQAHEAQREDVN